MLAILAFIPLRRLSLAALILTAPLALEAQTAPLADRAATGTIPVADLTAGGGELASSAAHLAKQAAPELTVSTLTVIGAIAASGMALRRKRQA